MLDRREVATVLAALRCLQLHTSTRSRRGKYAGHFAHVEPLTDDEIDALCARLNLGAVVTDLRLVPPDAEPLRLQEEP